MQLIISLCIALLYHSNVSDTLLNSLYFYNVILSYVSPYRLCNLLVSDLDTLLIGNVSNCDKFKLLIILSIYNY